MIYIRASILPMYFDCPRRSASQLFGREVESFDYKLKWVPKGIAAIVGTAAHESAGHVVDNLVDRGDRGKLGDATEKGIVRYRQEFEKGAEFDDTTPNNNHAEKQIGMLARSYFHEIAPGLDLVSVEREIKLKAQVDRDTVISGHIDYNSEETIRDLKTGRPGGYLSQLGGYSLLRNSNGYNKAGALYIDHLPRTPIAKAYPGARVIRADRFLCEEAAYSVIVAIQNSYNDFMKSGKAWAFPANPKSMLCNPKYCRAYDTKFCKLGGL